ncbi:MAG: hypothetical protein ACPGU6_02700 [Tenacibaculum sp.]
MKTLKLLFLLFFIQNIGAQTRLSKTEVEALPNTVKNQFIKLYRTSNNYQIYKVIKKNEFLELQKNILDSVKVIKKDVATKQIKINEQLKAITALQTKIDTLNNDLTTSINKEDNISFIGMSLSKGSYNTIVWSIIGALLVSLAFFIYKFNSSHSITRETKDLLSETELELEQYKKKAIEKEQKLRRQLQDEINKQRGVS